MTIVVIVFGVLLLIRLQVICRSLACGLHSLFSRGLSSPQYYIIVLLCVLFNKIVSKNLLLLPSDQHTFSTPQLSTISSSLEVISSSVMLYLYPSPLAFEFSFQAAPTNLALALIFFLNIFPTIQLLVFPFK